MADIGFPVSYLRQTIHSQYGYRFAKNNGKNTKYLIDTEEFERLRQKRLI